MTLRPKFSSACVVAVVGAGAALAQWSNDPSVNLPIADKPNDQVQPKVRITSDGGCYIVWFDNATGGYDVYLQRLGPGGVEKWAHNGVLLADRSVSSTVDYDMVVDAGDNAIVVFNDDRATPGGTQQVTVTKVDGTGAQVWGASGVTLTADTTFKGNPRVAALSDGTYVVGWTSNNIINYRKLDASGVPIGAGATPYNETGHYLALADMKAADNGGFISLWVRGSTTNPTTSSKALYSQKYDTNIANLWGATPVIVFNGTSVQNGYFPTFIYDGAGGAVYGWYETGGTRNCYVQHVLAAGTEKFAHNGVALSTTANFRISCAPAYDAANDVIFAAFEETNSVQSMWGLYAQKIDSAGTRAWATATEILPFTTNQNSFNEARAYGGGVIVYSFDARSATTGVVLAARLDASGASVWPTMPEFPCTRNTTKARLDNAIQWNGMSILAWSDGSLGSSDLLAQNINADGSFGQAPCPGDLDGNRTIDLSDLGIVLAHYGQAGGYAQGDLDGSGFVDLADVAIMLSAYGSNCP